MYWIAEEYEDYDGNTCYIYNFFKLKTITTLDIYIYTNLSREKVYKPKKDLIIGAYSATSEEDFLEWYNKNIEL